MGKVIFANIDTTGEIPADRVIESAAGKVDPVIIIGWDENDRLYFAASSADRGALLLLIETAKMSLLDEMKLGV